MMAERDGDYRSRLEDTTAATVNEQLDRAQKELPEVHAAYELLVRAVLVELIRADRRGALTAIGRLPMPLLEAVLSRYARWPWLRKDLCEAINRQLAWAAIHEFLETGVVKEPGHIEC